MALGRKRKKEAEIGFSALGWLDVTLWGAKEPISQSGLEKPHDKLRLDRTRLGWALKIKRGDGKDPDHPC